MFTLWLAGQREEHMLTLAVTNSGHKLIIYDLAHISTEHGTRVAELEKVLQRYVGNYTLAQEATTLLALYGAEHLNAESANLLRKKKVILIANDRTAEMKSAIAKTVWAAKLKPAVMETSLCQLRPSANLQEIQEVIKTANGDLRQALIQLAMGSESVTKGNHVYFDAKDAMCRRVQKGVWRDLDYHTRNWVSENHLQINKSSTTMPI